MQHIVALSYKKNYTEAMSKKRSDKTSSYTSDQNREKSSVQPSRPGGRSARVQAAVFEATLELLQEQGYEALSFPTIAERADVHKTTLYRRWETKEQLVLDAVENRVTQKIPLPDTGTLRTDLIHLVQHFATVLYSPLGQVLLQMSPVLSSSPSIGSFSKNYWQHRYPYLKPLFDRAIARGELSPQTDLQLLFEMLLGVLFVHVYVLGESLDSTLAERIVDLLMSGGGTIPVGEE